jgi:NADH dehydrogenase
MGRFAGHNAVNHLLGDEMLTMKIDEYVTCLDLGPWGALRTKGWDRRVVASGLAVKATKRNINCERIYPPQTGNPRDLLDFGTPVIQPPPPVNLKSSSS